MSCCLLSDKKRRITATETKFTFQTDITIHHKTDLTADFKQNEYKKIKGQLHNQRGAFSEEPQETYLGPVQHLCQYHQP